MSLRRTFTAFLAAVCVAGLTACGNDHAVSDAKSEGTYVTVDNLRYQVEISRQLNPTDIEDRDYLTGVAASDLTLKPDETWFGIFIRIVNAHKGGASLPTAPSFSVQDTQSNKFTPIPASNLIAYKPTSLGPKDTDPNGIEVAASASTQGKLLLFKIPNASLANRPLELTITGAAGGKGTVAIDV